MLRRFAIDVVDVGVLELALVAVGSSVDDHDFVAGPHRLSVELDVAREGAAEALSRGVVAQGFLDGVRDEAGIFQNPRMSILERHQVQREVSEKAHGGLDAGGKKRARRHQDLPRVEGLALDPGFYEARDEIVPRLFTPFIDDALR